MLMRRAKSWEELARTDRRRKSRSGRRQGGLPGEPPPGPSRVPVTHLEKGQRKNPPRASRSASQPCHPFGSARLGARNLLLPRRRRLVASPVLAGSRDAAAHGGPLVASLILAGSPEAPGKFPAGRTRTEPRGGLQARRGSCHSHPALARRLGPPPLLREA